MALSLIDPKYSRNIDKIQPLHVNDIMSHILVHEPIPPREVKYNPEAQKALQVEWDKLRDQGAWDLSSVREMGSLKEEYKKKGQVAHFGIVFSICHKKHAEKSKEHWKYLSLIHI